MTKEQTRYFHNINVILNKIEKNGFLSQIGDQYQSLIDKEITFAVKELYRMKQEQSKLNLIKDLK